MYEQHLLCGGIPKPAADWKTNLTIDLTEEANKSLEYLKQMNELDELYNSSIEEPLTKEETAKKADIIISKMIA
jgi:hypothetical protein